ncbi:hypothetical protein D9619_010546 [Psilocybe cf. subviscida]|uniref:Uncharacterized protein n=1 Tax=Psilocybe cf. subviscida TaxID=2480587 RepID=A0A8H5ASS0_9AGAR|nr:hypothetical protein D9619_010546 [Psilocybe cf. subviscida]
MPSQPSNPSPTQPTDQDYSTDEELPLWFVHTDQQRHATFESFESRMLLLRTQLDTTPHIIGLHLVALSKRFELLATEVCHYGFNVRDVGQDHWLFSFLESMWNLAVGIRFRLYGDVGIAVGRPFYSYSVGCIRGMVLNAHRFANLPLIFLPHDRTPLPENWYLL